jgi:hypothetical protein
MKQLLFLLLFPCLAMAQYTGNAGQKITLGEQTTADGLIYRGLAADTTRKPSVDTMAYILLDTNTNIIWQYKKATNNAWTRVGGSISSGVTGVLPVANGGTNAGVFTAGSVVFAGTSGTYTQDNSGLFYDNTNDRLGIGTASPNYKLHIKPTSSGRTVYDSRMLMTIESSSEAYYNINIPSNGAGGFRVFATPDNPIVDAAFEYWPFNDGNSRPYKRFHFYSSGYFGFNAKDNIERFRIDSTGYIGIGVIGPTEKLHVDGNARITAVGALGGNSATLYRNSDGVLSTTSSDINKKYNVKPIIYGLETISQLNPVNFQWNVDESEDIGFIAQDIQNIIPESIETDWDSNLIFKYEKLIPILTKAIQEQQALIKALEQRILTLENK